MPRDPEGKPGEVYAEYIHSERAIVRFRLARYCKDHMQRLVRVKGSYGVFS